MSQFPSNNLKLSTVLQAYYIGTTGSMSDLRGVTCYDSNANVFYAPAKGVKFSLLSTFGGKFPRPISGSVSDPPVKTDINSYDDFFGKGSIRVNIGPKSISYVIIGKILVQLSFAVSLKAVGQGYSSGEFTRDFSGSFQIDDGTTYNYPDITVDPVSSVQTFSVSGTSNVVITLTGGAQNDEGNYIGTTGIWTYNITPNGLV